MVERPTPRLSQGAQFVLRTAPPQQTVVWLLDSMEAARVLEIEPMGGASTAALHRVTVETSRGAQTPVVLRRYVLADSAKEAPDIVAHEATALDLVRSAPVPTPTLLAADMHGEHADAPALIMSWRPGRPRWEAKNRHRFVADLADAMIAVATTSVPAATRVRSIAGYPQTGYDPPAWATRPKVWQRAVEIFHGPIPSSDLCFVHRDFHPGNVLWTRSKISGLVDWQTAGIGPASIDPGHCRLNLLYYDPHLADELRTTWEHRAQRTYHPWADITAIIGVLDSLQAKNPSRSRLDIEDTLAQAVAELGG